MNDKIEELLNILEQVNDLYPDVDKIVINDPDDPDYIILSTTYFINKMSDSLGIEGLEELTEEYDIINPDKKKPLQ